LSNDPSLDPAPEQRTFEDLTLLERKAIRALADYIGNGSIPIVGDDGQVRAFEGTGTLFRFGDSAVLVLAAHVRPLIEAGFAFIPLGGGDQTRIRGDFAEATGREDPDVLAIRLPSELAEALEGRYRAHSTGDLFNPNAHTALGYMLAGFQNAERDPLDPRSYSVPMKVLAREYEGSLEDLWLEFRLDPYAHLLLTYERAWATEGGESRELPDPRGISGCSVWAVVGRQESAVWDPGDRVRIFAVETSVIRNRWIRSTRWGVVARLLFEAWPDVGAVLDEEFGPLPGG